MESSEPIPSSAEESDISIALRLHNPEEAEDRAIQKWAAGHVQSIIDAWRTGGYRKALKPTVVQGALVGRFYDSVNAGATETRAKEIALERTKELGAEYFLGK